MACVESVEEVPCLALPLGSGLLRHPPFLNLLVRYLEHGLCELARILGHGPMNRALFRVGLFAARCSLSGMGYRPPNNARARIVKKANTVSPQPSLIRLELNCDMPCSNFPLPGLGAPHWGHAFADLDTSA